MARRRGAVKVWWLGAVLLGAAVAPLPGGTASASCAAPYFVTAGGEASVPPVALRGGEDLTVEGRAFVIGCNDSQSVQVLPFGCERRDPPEPEIPMTDVHLVLRQHGQRWDLGSTDARTAEDGELGWVTWDFRLPDGVQDGPAVLLADEDPGGRGAPVATLPVLVRGAE